MPCVKPDVKGGQFSDLRTLFGRVGVHTHKISCESHHSRFRIQLTSSFFAMADGGKAASKEVNLALKAAKEAIKQKEYKEALKYCKVIYKKALNSAQLRPFRAKNQESFYIIITSGGFILGRKILGGRPGLSQLLIC